jgi:hypothetical protein
MNWPRPSIISSTIPPSPVNTPSRKKATSKARQEPSPEASIAKGKRPRSLTSPELTSLLKRAGVTTRRRAQAVEAVAQLGEGDDEGEEGELPSLEELVKQE